MEEIVPAAKVREHYTITHLSTAAAVLENIDQLSQILKLCIDEGIDIGFGPLTTADAEAYWRNTVLAQIAAGTSHLFILTSPSSPTPNLILGTVQLFTIPEETQKHCGDVTKLMVRAESRRRGVATELMRHAEGVAKGMDINTLNLGTATGNSNAKAMYNALGWEEWRTCKGHVCWPDGVKCDVSFFRKEI